MREKERDEMMVRRWRTIFTDSSDVQGKRERESFGVNEVFYILEGAKRCIQGKEEKFRVECLSRNIGGEKEEEKKKKRERERERKSKS